ncbi:hypothetical protein EVAR_83187_1 [Eumeta japonica]|uniref:Uncharacterized protein n=1 Tax=Eumeta variegata TaxID=151549 RepID=A0A4C1YTI2_EUMVA|nr:hypothetical protein EVAR_83187_1 [Eumeta japonica]
MEPGMKNMRESPLQLRPGASVVAKAPHRPSGVTVAPLGAVLSALLRTTYRAQEHDEMVAIDIKTECDDEDPATITEPVSYCDYKTTQWLTPSHRLMR